MHADKTRTRGLWIFQRGTRKGPARFNEEEEGKGLADGLEEKGNEDHRKDYDTNEECEGKRLRENTLTVIFGCDMFSCPVFFI